MGKRRKGYIKYIRPPEEHLYEKLPMPLQISSMKGFIPLNYTKRPHKTSQERKHKWIKLKPIIVPDTSSINESITYLPVAWGWNANNRCGNLTISSSHSIQQVQRSAPHNFIQSSAGKMHSLLINNKGNIFSFGSGKYAQLGIGNPFTDTFLRQDTYNQATPKQVTPTGIIQRGKDLRFSQVSCGATFSLARQIHTIEALNLISGFYQLENSFNCLKETFPDCQLIAHNYTMIKQEKSESNQMSGGKVVSFGTGLNGQLGLGKSNIVATSPTLIPKFKYISIVKISSGENHSLAIDSNGNVYAWGSNLHGKLGLQDHRDRYEPEMIKYLSSFYVTDCSAGDNHSAVIMYSRKQSILSSSKNNIKYLVSTFGRGCHGRLGNGSTKKSEVPLLAHMHLLPSIETSKYMQVSCGGAHTMVLISKDIPKSLSNPWGLSTTIVSWGYGTNGQLGNGQALDSLVPVKAIMPRSVIIKQISAGHSWSLATAINGDIYAWGKGFRGQLGLETRVIVVVPKKVPFIGSMVQLCAGYEHNIGISTKSKNLNEKTIQSRQYYDCSSKLFEDKSTLEEQCSRCSYGVGCPRRYPNARRQYLRYTCRSCMISRICYDCMKLCHNGHDVIERPLDDFSRTKATFCECGVFQIKDCKLLPVYDEEEEYTESHHTAATKIQRMSLRMTFWKSMKKSAVVLRRRRFQICANYWFDKVIAPIWEKVRKGTESRKESVERERMAIEEDIKRKFDYYFKQQTAIVAMNALVYGTRHLISKASIIVNCKQDNDIINKEYSPNVSYALSWHSLRYQQLQLHHERRLDPAAIAKAIQYMPIIEKREYLYFDRDLSLFYRRFVRDVFMMRFLWSIELQKKRKHDLKLKEAEEEADSRRQARLAKSMLLENARALGRGEEIKEEADDEEEDFAQAKLRIKENDHYRNSLKMKLQREHFFNSQLDVKFIPLNKYSLPIKRRHSIVDSTMLYSRLTEMRPNLYLKAFANRSFSVPIKLNELYQVADMNVLQVRRNENIVKSLELFSARYGQILEIIDESYSYLWDRIAVEAKRKRLIYISTLSWLNPRLPLDIRRMIREERNTLLSRRKRSRSIADSERLAKQTQIMFLTRNSLAKLRHKAYFQESSLLRRRSFDYGECIDAQEGILDSLGYQLEHPVLEKLTVNQLLSDSEMMGRRLERRWSPSHLADEERAAYKLLPSSFSGYVLDG